MAAPWRAAGRLSDVEPRAKNVADDVYSLGIAMAVAIPTAVPASTRVTTRFLALSKRAITSPPQLRTASSAESGAALIGPDSGPALISVCPAPMYKALRRS